MSASANPSEASAVPRPPDARPRPPRPRSPGTALATALALLAACGGGAAPEAPPRTVASAFTTTWWPSSGVKTTEPSPQPLGTTVSALVPDGSVSGYRDFPGALALDGSFSIPGVPAGRYLLRVDRPARAYHRNTLGDLVTMDFTRTELTECQGDAPALERLSGRRASWNTPTTQTATLELSNLAPWSPSDFLWMASPDLSMDTVVTQALIAADATTATVADVPWNTLGGLPDAGAGDVLYAFQRERVALTGATNRLTTRYARLAVPDLSGGAANVAVPLLEAPLSESLPIDLRASAFAALLPELAPAMGDGGLMTVGVGARPHANTYPVVEEQAMRYLLVQASASGGDLNLGAVAYGGFGEAWWRQYRNAGLSFVARLDLPPGTSLSVFGVVGTVEPLPGASAPITPRLGPVAAPRVNGEDAFVSRSVGAPITVSWSAPALGAPSAYVVRVVPALQDFSSEVLRATVYGSRSLRIPDGVLTPGQPYYAVITAVQGPAYLVDRSPYLRGYPSHEADVVTAVFWR